MNTERENTEMRVQREYYPVCWCGPVSNFGAILFGTILLLVGGVLLLDNLFLIPGILADNIWPLVLIGIGAAYLGSVLYARR